jgi:two-component system, response regulator YesN
MWHKIFYRYLLSYLCIFLVPFIVFGVLIVSVFLRDFREKAMAEEEALVHQAVEDVENELKTVERTVLSITGNKFFLPEIINLSPYYPIETIQELERYRDQESLYFDIVYIPRGSAQAYGSLSSYRTDAIPETIYQAAVIDPEEFRRLVSEISSPVLTPVQRVTYFRGDWNMKPLLLAFHPIPPKMEIPYGTVLFLIYPDVLFDEVKWLAGHRHGRVVITDEKSRTVFQKNAMFDEHDNIDGYGSDTTATESGMTDLSQRMIEWSVRSDVTDWVYTWHFPESTSLSQVKVLERRFLLVMILCGFFSMGIIFVMMNVNYKPLVTLKRTLEEELHREIGRSRGLEGLNTLIHDLLDKNTTLEEMVRNSTILFKEKLLRGIITGEYDDWEVDRISALIGFRLVYETYRVAVVAPHSTDGTLPEWLAKAIEYVNGRLAEKVSQHADGIGDTDAGERHGEAPQGELIDAIDRSRVRGCLSYSRYVVLILGYESNHDEGALKELLLEITHATRTPLICGLGNEYTVRREISASCREAIVTVEENIHDSAKPLLRYSDLPDAIQWSIPSRKELLEKLKGDILSGNVSEWNTCMMQARDDIKKRSHLLPVIRHFLLNLFEYAETLIPGLRSSFSDLPETVELLEMTTEEQILGAIDTLRRRVSALLSERRDDAVVERVTNYINERYADPNLSVEEIAEELDLSYSYLSRFFKAKTGVGLSEYLIRFRIGKFKSLVSMSDEPIASLISKIGYRGSYQFGRVFKKHEGLPPSEYRKIYANRN